MEPLSIVALIGVVIALAALPSTSTIVVATRSLGNGLDHGLAVAAGVALGDLVFVGLALGGLSAAAEALGQHFAVVRYLGGVYLIGFGISLLRRGPRTQTKATDPTSRIGSFAVGLAITLGDLKAVFFYAALLPAFVDVPGLALGDAVVVAAAVVVAVGGVKAAYAYLAHRVAAAARRETPQRIACGVAGCASIGAGVVLLTRA